MDTGSAVRMKHYKASCIKYLICVTEVELGLPHPFISHLPSDIYKHLSDQSSFPQTKQIQITQVILNPFLIWEMLRALYHLCGPLLDPF